MATATRRLLPALLKTLAPAGARGLSTEKAVGAAAVVGSHTAKWMQVGLGGVETFSAGPDHRVCCYRLSNDTSKKSPMELINEVPPIKVDGRIAVCEGAAEGVGLGHPIEYICLDLEAPNNAALATTSASVPSRKSWLPAGFGGSGKHGATIDIPLEDPKKKERELLSWEQDLKRREQDIKRREDAMNRAGVVVEVRNWPQFYPIIHHDIANEIPIHAQKLQYTAFASWLDIVSFLLAVIYAMSGCPLSYILWYRPLYRAMRTDSVVTFGQFFVFYSIHVGFCVIAAIAPPIIFRGKTLTGILVAIEILAGDMFVGVLYFIGFVFFALESLISIWVLERVYMYFRGHR
ncbi:secretory carrier-associated membrane protein 5-like [Panicum miliaceum]|uniref:Secretory carrier-associated membrane protein n=1 Tax=Panicum miliaceum TaxID=4540 RepID=A0A3L6RM09_PANMI|nr:secretory carrier-associated membrane protein 5-like [Panicum miliaceum]